MEIINKNIDHGRAFDWGKTSEDYAKYRDIYPKEFYAKLEELSLGVKGQNVLDLGTGTGVIPRNMYPTEQNGQGQIFRRIRFYMQRNLAKMRGWTLIILLLRQRMLIFQTKHLM